MLIVDITSRNNIAITYAEMYRETTSNIFGPVQISALRPVSESSHLLMASCIWDDSALHDLEWAHSPDDNTEDELPHGTLAETRLSPRGEMGVPKQML